VREGLLFVFFSVAGGQTRGLTTPFEGADFEEEGKERTREVTARNIKFVIINYLLTSEVSLSQGPSSSGVVCEMAPSDL
jgi:hypothetical protein